MKIGIISDVHSNKDALNLVLKEFEEKNIDKIICVGDVIGIGPYPAECIDILMENKDKFIAFVKGNHEGYLINGLPKHNHNRECEKLLSEEELETHRWNHRRLNEKQIEFIKTWIPSIELEIEGKKIIIEHYPTENGKFLTFYKVPTQEQMINMTKNKKNNDIFIFGHTHIDLYYNENNRVFINPGSLGCPILTGGANYGILEIENGKVSYNQYAPKYDVDKVIDEIRTLKYSLYESMIKIFYKR